MQNDIGHHPILAGPGNRVEESLVSWTSKQWMVSEIEDDHCVEGHVGRMVQEGIRSSGPRSQIRTAISLIETAVCEITHVRWCERDRL